MSEYDTQKDVRDFLHNTMPTIVAEIQKVSKECHESGKSIEFLINVVMNSLVSIFLSSITTFLAHCPEELREAIFLSLLKGFSQDFNYKTIEEKIKSVEKVECDCPGCTHQKTHTFVSESSTLH